MKYANKAELIERIEEEHRAFVELVDGIPQRRHKEEGVWGDGWNIHDLLAHLMAWEQMFLRWHRQGRAGETPALPAPGYKWNETPRLNEAIWKRYRRRGMKTIRREFDASYEEILGVARSMTEAELFERGHYAWTKKNHVVSYLGANTVSHYRTASKIFKRWLRGSAKSK